LLVPERVPVYMNRFKDQVMRQINQFLWVPRPNAMEVVHDAMQPAIRYALEECIDLPPCIYETRQAELTPEQKKAYKDMLTKLSIEAAEGRITAANEAVKAQKLIQVACGVVYGGDDIEVDLDVGPRMEVLTEIIEQAGAKVIVFVPFVSVVNKVVEEVRNAGFTAECIYGDVSKTERDRIFKEFQSGRNPRVLVANAGAMSHGLTLTAANVTIWYGPTTSNETWSQANARTVRPGQRLHTTIVQIEGSEIERRMYERLQHKGRMQGLLLDLVRG
jgi:SNF2 family DNA or RNA helicase